MRADMTAKVTTKMLKCALLVSLVRAKLLLHNSVTDTTQRLTSLTETET